MVDAACCRIEGRLDVGCCVVPPRRCPWSERQFRAGRACAVDKRSTAALNGSPAASGLTFSSALVRAHLVCTLVSCVNSCSRCLRSCFWRADASAAVATQSTRTRQLRSARSTRLLVTIPQYPGARLIGRHDSATSYHVPDGFIDAEPYASDLRYDLSTSVSGAAIQRYFRRVMRARGWSCQFQHRTPGVPYGFECALRGSTVGAYIADHGLYELDVAATHRRPPIQTVTVPGD
jgi:hypothetical protein